MKINNILYVLTFLILSCKNSKKENSARVNYLPYFNEASFTPKWINPKSNELINFHKIPDLSMASPILCLGHIYV